MTVSRVPVDESHDGLPMLIESLKQARAYPHPVSTIEVLETHISWVLLTGSFAYKIKKPVKFEFLDFSTLERRRQLCLHELRLNRRWSSGLYVDVVPITGSPESPSVGGDGAPIEYAVKMVQFPQEARLDKQLDAGLLSAADLVDLAESVAEQHGRAVVAGRVGPDDALDGIRGPVAENFRTLEPYIASGVLGALSRWSEAVLHELEPTLVQRHDDGFVREVHGDLHLGNLVRWSSGIVAFDCVEFNEELRTIDVLSDVAFLVMDLTFRNREDLAYAFLNRYLERTGDYAGMAVFGFYYVYHCMIRAKVAALRGAERSATAERKAEVDESLSYCELAKRWIDRPAPYLVAMHGLSGSGKTWLSSRLLCQVPAIRVRSDLERKRLLDLDEAARTGSGVGAGVYDNAGRASVYERLFDLSRDLLEAGYAVIVDATFLRHSERQRAAALAASAGVPLCLVHTSAGTDTLRQRVERRRETGADASEATAAVLRYQLAEVEALTDTELSCAVVVPTDRPVDIADIGRRVASSVAGYKPAVGKDSKWEHFEHDADIGLRATAASREGLFQAMGEALTAVITDPGGVRLEETVDVHCEAPDDALLLVDWLNAIVYEMATRGMVFGRWRVALDGRELEARLEGEKLDRTRHRPVVEVKGATYTALKVTQGPDGRWLGQCIVDV